jgi:hypothetical protein
MEEEEGQQLNQAEQYLLFGHLLNETCKELGFFSFLYLHAV